MKKPQLPSEIYVDGDIISWPQFCINKAREANIKYASAKIKITAQDIENLAYICRSEEDLPEDSPPALWEILEDICRCLEKSNDYQQSNNHMTDTTTIDMPVNELETSLGDIVATEQEVEPLSPQAQEYVATLEAQEKEQLDKRNPQEANSQELAIVQAAHAVGVSISLHDAYSKLSETFDLGENNSLKPKVNSLVTPMALAQAMAYGARISSGGDWIYADAVNMLMALGHEDPVIQIASMLGRAESTVYNWSRTANRVPVELRNDAIPISTYVEIATKRYESDDEKNNEAIAELVKQAACEKWSQGEARSHSRHRQGKDDAISDGSGNKKVKPARYLVIFPGNIPIFTNTEPAWSTGIQAYDTKQHMRLFDDGSQINWVPVALEPTDEQVRELQESNG